MLSSKALFSVIIVYHATPPPPFVSFTFVIRTVLCFPFTMVTALYFTFIMGTLVHHFVKTLLSLACFTLTFTLQPSHCYPTVLTPSSEAFCPSISPPIISHFNFHLPTFNLQSPIFNIQ
ncbi:hypothetical protein GQ43DRAFT_152332 [Delitschia confertaspora ATCC 74209]|uniref:Uncharacterized protein n=1 Tax=Delitschia confertaspora ATCC 74209 TaxID=1513339 RepID=A0A9P4MVW7_9PLEO|nr:hypothetical protein GQ43DRAFT_152332 [Delitschia confertaspora ATCC 74209]